jgi:uncharacterized membrane protein
MQLSANAGQFGATDAPEKRRQAPKNRLVKESVEQFAHLTARERHAMGFGDRMAGRISAMAGSLPFALMNGVFFAVWLLINSELGGMPAFDPYPFGALTVIVSLEAIFLAIFVLMSQNRQSTASDHRASVDMHMNAITEREITKVLELLQEISEQLGAHTKQDTELQHMMQRTDVKELTEAIEDVEDRLDEVSEEKAPSANEMSGEDLP